MDRGDPRFLWLSLRSTAQRGAGYRGSLLISAHTGRSRRGWKPWIKGEQPSHRDWWKANAWLSLISFTSTILPEVGGAYVLMCVRKGTNNTPLGWDFIKQILVMNNGVVTLIECERGEGWSTMQKRQREKGFLVIPAVEVTSSSMHVYGSGWNMMWIDYHTHSNYSHVLMHRKKEQAAGKLEMQSQ